MKQYIDGIKNILENGSIRGDRTGEGTISVFGTQYKFDLRDGFPLLTTKKMAFKTMLRETLWFLSGSSDNATLERDGIKIWSPFASKKSNTIGPVYGPQWRKWNHCTQLDELRGILRRLDDDKDEMGAYDAIYEIKLHLSYVEHGGGLDQIATLLDGLKNRPFSRRHIVSSWNVPYLPDESIPPHENVDNGRMSLAPCHLMHQCYVDELDGCKYLDLMVYIRSNDAMLGKPFNIAQYAIMLMLYAQHCGYIARNLIVNCGDDHIYLPHVENAKVQIEREPFPLPTLRIDLSKGGNIFKLTESDFHLEGYQHHDKLPFDLF